MPPLSWRLSVASCLAPALLLLAGCERKEQTAQTNFYQRRIGPILEQSCAEGPAKAGCHVRADDKGNALGNLSLESYDDIARRKDLLVNYGPYGMPGLLVKVAPTFKLALTNWKSGEPAIINTNIAHVGGSLIDITSTSFTQLQTWMENGAAENNARQADRQYDKGACSTVVGTDPAFAPNVDPDAPDFASFQNQANRVLGASCAASNCHGAGSNSLHLTCGSTPEQLRWNYFAVRDYVSTVPSFCAQPNLNVEQVDECRAAAARSEILRRPLSVSAGGTYHEGGTVFPGTSDPDYRALLDWATDKGGPTTVDDSEGFVTFTERVQPMLVRRGCMMLGCHSSSMFHDYRLRGGSGGHFGLPATRKNYELTLEQLALDTPNPEASRLIRKNLIPAPSGLGILHRGGSLLAEHPEVCPDTTATGPLDDQSEYCVITAWIEMERKARMPAAGLSGIVFVRRAPAPLPDTPQDYGTFAAGAELVRVVATQDETAPSRSAPKTACPRCAACRPRPRTCAARPYRGRHQNRFLGPHGREPAVRRLHRQRHYLHARSDDRRARRGLQRQVGARQRRAGSQLRPRVLGGRPLGVRFHARQRDQPGGLRRLPRPAAHAGGSLEAELQPVRAGRRKNPPAHVLVESGATAQLSCATVA